MPPQQDRHSRWRASGGVSWLVAPPAQVIAALIALRMKRRQKRAGPAAVRAGT